jgi:hypothetical protein
VRHRACHPVVRTLWAALLLALLLFALPLWVASWFTDNLWERNDTHGFTAVLIRDGTILWFDDRKPLTGEHFAWRHQRASPPATRIFGWRFRCRIRPDGSSVECPTWLPAALLAIIGTPLLVWIRRRDQAFERSKQGCCPACGYDLRATPDSCPECGREPSSANRFRERHNRRRPPIRSL